MDDSTEETRRMLQKAANEPQLDRPGMEAKYGQVWDTKEMTGDFMVTGFLAPFVAVVKKDTMQIGTLMFQHSPRFYFSWTPGAPEELI